MTSDKSLIVTRQHQAAFLANMPMTLNGIARTWDGVVGWSVWSLKRLIVQTRLKPVFVRNNVRYYEPIAVVTAMYGETGATCIFWHGRLPHQQEGP